MNSHTPGPWTLIEVPPIGNPYWREFNIKAGELLVLNVDATNTHTKAEANARLIAAAPELLKALREMVRYDDLPEEEQQPAVERARAAIAKATQ